MNEYFVSIPINYKEHPITNQLYFDPFTASLYDEQYDFQTQDVAFYLSECKKAAGKILEIACGTGRLLLPSLEAGCDIEGLDLSGEMLNVLRRKLQAKHLKTKLHQQSMLDFSLNDKFALIYIPFTSFFILQSQEDQIDCLKNCRRHLTEGGKFIIDFFVNSCLITVEQDNSTRFVNEKKHEGNTVMIYETVRNNAVLQKKNIYYNYEFYDKNGLLLKNELRAINLRWVYPDEFKLMAKIAGFESIEIFGNFNYEPLVSDRQRMVGILS